MIVVEGMPRRPNFKLDPTVWGSRCSPHTAAQFGVGRAERDAFGPPPERLRWSRPFSISDQAGSGNRPHQRLPRARGCCGNPRKTRWTRSLAEARKKSLDRANGDGVRYAANMANTISQTLGEVLRASRVAADLSLRDLAKKLSISPSYISDIENDRRVPSEEVLQGFAKELGLKFDDLMARTGRVGEQAERYLKHHPAAGALFRRISERRLPEEDLQKLLHEADQMGTKKEIP